MGFASDALSGMSVSVNLFLADASEAEALASADDPSAEWPNCSLQGVTNFELIELTRVILEAEHGLELLHGDGEDGPLVMRHPDVLVSKLAAMDHGEQDRVASRWRNETEEFADRSLSEVAGVLTQFSELAAEAVRSVSPSFSSLHFERVRGASRLDASTPTRSR